MATWGWLTATLLFGLIAGFTGGCIYAKKKTE